MAQADNTETLYAEIPPALKYLADSDDRPNKEVVIAALERELGVSTEDSTAAIDRKMRRLEQRLDEEQEALRQHRDSVSSLKKDLTRLRDLREQKADDAAEYEDALDAILDDMEAGDLPYVAYYHARVDELRELVDRSAEEIHLDLQQRAGAQDRDLQHNRFMDKREAEQTDGHPISEEWPGGEDDA